VIADLPVGENLQDQVIGDGVTFFTPYSGVSVTVVKSENFDSAWVYSLFGTGTFIVSSQFTYQLIIIT